MLSLTNISIKRTEKHLDLLKQQRIHINERVECSICKKRIMER
jgi:predicted methyltransferase